jgi:hypothetical protein
MKWVHVVSLLIVLILVSAVSLSIICDSAVCLLPFILFVPIGVIVVTQDPDDYIFKSHDPKPAKIANDKTDLLF